jgi:hypothetical protein
MPARPATASAPKQLKAADGSRVAAASSAVQGGSSKSQQQGKATLKRMDSDPKPIKQAPAAAAAAGGKTAVVRRAISNDSGDSGSSGSGSSSNGSGSNGSGDGSTVYTSSTDTAGEADLGEYDSSDTDAMTETDYASDGFVEKDEDDDEDDGGGMDAMENKAVVKMTDEQFVRRWDKIYTDLQARLDAGRISKSRYNENIGTLDTQEFEECKAIEKYRAAQSKRAAKAAAA